jgi:23S rRNA (adenine2503-C2)-methyltransferase
VDRGRTRAITNVVMMGMGEPLANFDAVVPALKRCSTTTHTAVRRRVTLSTSGLVPWIDRLRAECPVALAVSLHAPDDRAARPLVPINRKHPLADLMAACRRYLDRSAARLHHVRVRHAGRRERQPAHADELVRLVADVPCKLNLIPFNPFPGTEFRTSPRERIVAASRSASERGIVHDRAQDARR